MKDSEGGQGGTAADVDDEAALRREVASLRRSLRRRTVAAATALVLSACAPGPEFTFSGDGPLLVLAWPWERFSLVRTDVIFLLAEVMLPVAFAVIALLLVRGRVASGRSAVLLALSTMFVLTRTADTGEWIWMQRVVQNLPFGLFGFGGGSPGVRVLLLIAIAGGARGLLLNPRSRASRLMTTLGGGSMLIVVLSARPTGIGLWHILDALDDVENPAERTLLLSYMFAIGLLVLTGGLALFGLRREPDRRLLKVIVGLAIAAFLVLPMVWWWSYYVVTGGFGIGAIATPVNTSMIVGGYALWAWGLAILGTTSLTSLIRFEELRDPVRRIGGVFE